MVDQLVVGAPPALRHEVGNDVLGQQDTSFDSFSHPKRDIVVLTTKLCDHSMEKTKTKLANKHFLDCQVGGGGGRKNIVKGTVSRDF